MITIEEVTSVDMPEFEQLFQASLPAIDGGSYHWPVMGNPETYEDKLAAFKDYANGLLSAPNGRGLLWRVDGVPVHYAVGFFNIDDPTYLTWAVGLYGPDGNGSRAWLYSDEYITKSKEFLRDVWGLEGHRLMTFANSSVHSYHLRKVEGTSYYDVSVSEPHTNDAFPGTSVVTVSYRYL